tara:strand:- start:687 stop:3410 length:2724 start_codon:yes stop_codon:yes gene_type:complete
MMKPFSLVIGATAFFIAGCAAYFSVRGIALTFGAVSTFTIPIMLMASSLEIGKLVAASFLYRDRKSSNTKLRIYLSLAVLLLIGITSAGIYGYLSQAFEQTLSQVDGYESEISSLQRQQGEFDRLIQAYQASGQRGSVLREEKQGVESARLEKYIEERRKDIISAEQSKARLADETDEMILGERQKREEEKKRLQEVILLRRADVAKLEEDRKQAKAESDQRIEREVGKEEKINQRISELDAAVKVYRDQGPGGFLKEDGFKKAAELLKTQGEEREALRRSLTEINAAVQKARDDFNQRYSSLDSRIESIQAEIADANQKITDLTTGGAEQADNIRTALENLQQARSSVDDRIQALESEIAEASKKITAMSEISSAFGPDSSEELEDKKSVLQTKKEDAERRILELEGKIRSTDIGSFKFVARAIDSEVAVAEATENPILIEEALDRAVNRVVKWFILILVVVFDPLAVALVIAFNASLEKKKEEEEVISSDKAKKKNGFQSVGLIVIAACALLYGIYEILPETEKSKLSEKQSTGTYPVGELVSNRVDDRAFAYVPAQSFGVCSFSSLRMVEEVGMPKIIPDELLARVPFLKDMVWDPQSCGVKPNGRALYFMQLPSESYRLDRPGDVLFGLILPIGSDEKVKNFILSQLDLKAQKPNWKVWQNKLPDFHSIHHKSAHISIGLDQNCLLLLTSWWTDQPDPDFLDAEMQSIFQFGQGLNTLHPKLVSKLRTDDYDVALFLLGENFFDPFKKSLEEAEVLNTFRDLLSFDLSIKAKSRLDGVSIEGEYDYKKNILDAGFGLKVASLLDQVRESPNAVGLSTVFGEFVEIFLQRLDYQSVVNTLERIDLKQSKDFEAFNSWDCASRIHGARNGTFSIKAESSETGGASLRLAIDLLVESLNPFDSSLN